MTIATHPAHVRTIRTVTLLTTILVLAAGSWTPPAQAAPAPAPAWHRQAGFQANAVAVDKDRNVYVVGSLKPGPRWTLMLRKYALDGSLIWARNWRPAKAGYVNGRDVALAPDGGVYVVGDVAIPGSEGSGWFIARYAPDGRRRWVHDEPGWESGKLADSYGSVAVAGDRLIVAGNRFGCCGNPFNHGYLRSYTTGGKPVWRIPFDAPAIDPKFYDGATGVAGGTSGMFFVTGWAATALQMGETDFVDQDVVIQAVTSGGHVAWTRVLGDHGTRDVDRGTAIAVRGDRLAVTGDVDQRGFVRSHAWLGAFTLGRESPVVPGVGCDQARQPVDNRGCLVRARRGRVRGGLAPRQVRWRMGHRRAPVRRGGRADLAERPGAGHPDAAGE